MKIAQNKTSEFRRNSEFLLLYINLRYYLNPTNNRVNLQKHLAFQDHILMCWSIDKSKALFFQPFLQSVHRRQNLLKFEQTKNIVFHLVLSTFKTSKLHEKILILRLPKTFFKKVQSCASSFFNYPPRQEHFA